MASPSKSANLLRRIAGALRTFDCDQRGTSLTEFVVILPVFITLFVGIVELNKIERAGVRVKALAAKDTWEQAMAVHDGGIIDVDHGYPQMAAANALSTASSYPSPHGDNFERLKNFGLMSGPQDEADRATMLPDLVGGNVSQAPDPTRGSTFPRDMLDESRWNPVSSGSGGLSIFNGSAALSNFGPNQPIAAGIRYGMVGGKYERDVESFGSTSTLSAAYDVHVSPVSVPKNREIITVGFSRLMAEEDSCLSNILELSRDLGYLSNCF